MLINSDWDVQHISTYESGILVNGYLLRYVVKLRRGGRILGEKADPSCDDEMRVASADA